MPCEVCGGTQVYKGKALDVEKQRPGQVEGVIRNCPVCGDSSANALELYAESLRAQGLTVEQQQRVKDDVEPDPWRAPCKRVSGFK